MNIKNPLRLGRHVYATSKCIRNFAVRYHEFANDRVKIRRRMSGASFVPRNQAGPWRSASARRCASCASAPRAPASACGPRASTRAGSTRGWEHCETGAMRGPRRRTRVPASVHCLLNSPTLLGSTRARRSQLGALRNLGSVRSPSEETHASLAPLPSESSYPPEKRQHSERRDCASSSVARSLRVDGSAT